MKVLTFMFNWSLPLLTGDPTAAKATTQDCNSLELACWCAAVASIIFFVEDLVRWFA